MKYYSRLSDKTIQEYLRIFGAVVIEGPKWCGKTSSGHEFAKSVFNLTATADGLNNHLIAENDMRAVLTGDHPRMIDEWQEVPPIWDAVRNQVDEEEKKGLYILTGSSTPNDNLTIHSGAGRFGHIAMSTMSLYELGLSSGEVSLGKMLYNKTYRPKIESGKLTLDELINLLCRGGWPGLIDIPVKASQKVLRNYVETLTHEDVSRVDGTHKDPEKISALLESLARNSASLVSKETLARDIAANGRTNLSTVTIDDYLSILRRVFVLKEIPAWRAALKATTRLRVSPKRMLVDPSLAVAALRTDPAALKRDLKFVGNLFESWVLHDLLIYAQVNDAEVNHYNDNTDLEIDAVISGIGGAWGAVEIKLSYTGEDEGAKSLLRLANKIDKMRQEPPKFLAVVTGVGSVCRKRPDGVWVVPVDCLGA